MVVAKGSGRKGLCLQRADDVSVSCTISACVCVCVCADDSAARPAAVGHSGSSSATQSRKTPGFYFDISWGLLAKPVQEAGAPETP